MAATLDAADIQRLAFYTTVAAKEVCHPTFLSLMLVSAVKQSAGAN